MVIVLNDGRIYAERNVKALVRVIFKDGLNFDNASNHREWMQKVSERSGGEISARSERKFFNGCVKAGLFMRLCQGSKVQP
jgi:hypothetical protein